MMVPLLTMAALSVVGAAPSAPPTISLRHFIRQQGQASCHGDTDCAKSAQSKWSDPANTAGSIEDDTLGSLPLVAVDDADPFVSPSEFYRRYVRARKPAIFRGLAKSLCVYELWRNETWLAENRGYIPFDIDIRKRHGSEIQAKQIMTLSTFLETYRNDTLFLDEPISHTSLWDDLGLPSPLQCDFFAERIVTANILWAEGETSSYLHHDGSDNFLMVLSGSRDALVARPSASEALYADDFVVDNGLSPIDPDAIDLARYPRVSEVQWYHGKLETGDILYIPQFWWHQLRGSGSPAIAISLWFQSFNFDARFTVPDHEVVATANEFERYVSEEPDSIVCTPGAHAFGRLADTLGNETEFAKLEDPRPQLPPDNTPIKIPITTTIPKTPVPALMLGTARLGDRAEEVLKMALDIGYRGFDSGAIDGYSEATLGRVLAESGVPRSDLFITAKLNPKDHGYDRALASVRESLAALQTNYVDLLLIHTPACELEVDLICAEGPTMWRDSWRAMEELHAAGVAKHLGVSNFEVDELDHLLTFAKVKPILVQNWFDPLHRDRPVRKWCRAHGAGFQAYSLLGSVWTDEGAAVNPVLTNERIVAIAKEQKRSPAQIILRWAFQSGVGVLVGAQSREHLRLDLSLGDFRLTKPDMKALNGLSHRKKKYADSDACLETHCAPSWAACETAHQCAVCEKSCEGDETDAGYYSCCQSCIHGESDEVITAMNALLDCYRYCLQFEPITVVYHDKVQGGLQIDGRKVWGKPPT